MNLRFRVDRLERGVPRDDEPSLMIVAAEAQRLDRWLAEQGYPDPHDALLVGLTTPPGFRVSIEGMARADEEAAAWQWQHRQKGAAREERRASTDFPGMPDVAERVRQQAEHARRKAEEHPRQLAAWGIDEEGARRILAAAWKREEKASCLP